MNILSLNINGFGKGDFKLEWVNNLIRSHKVSVVGIQETKIKLISDVMIRRLWGSMDFDFHYVKSTGQGGGILCCWNKNLFIKYESICRNDCLIIKGKELESGNPLCLINVYASQDTKQREDLWHFLSAFLTGWNDVAIIFGDFNDVRNERERRGSVMDVKATRLFNNFINNNNLVEAKMGGSNFTWNKGGGAKRSKLDRFLVSDNYGDYWPNFEVHSDLRLFSDHKPLVLKHVRRNFGNIPFKFYNSWLGMEDCDQIVQEVWENFQIQGQHLKIYIVMQKLKTIKEKLRAWSANKRLKKEEDKRKFLANLNSIDNLIEIGQGSNELLTNRINLISSLRLLDKKENEDIAQKFKNRWCLEGDENTALYHKIINKKKHSMGIKGVDINGVWEVESSKVKDHFKNYYENLFKKDQDCSWSHDLGETSQITPREKGDLEKNFDEKELKDAIWGSGHNKSPGPDGFTMEFYKFYWEIIKTDLLEAFNDFANKPILPKGAISTFITLIPKVNNPIQVKDFRPISLISSIYKILAKMLANRLKKVLPRVIDITQSAFIKNRQLTDGPLIVNEVVDWAKAKKKSMFIFKSDIAKAFDSVSWDYLDSILDQKGFGFTWRRWMRVCLSSGSSSILINASPSSEFRLGRGLRQGDPLSPFLFTLVMEGLNEAIKKAVQNNTYVGTKIGDDNILLTHSFFADDSIFFGEWSVENILNLTRILFCFQKSAGLKLNLEKSVLFGLGQNHDVVEAMAMVIGCKAGRLPMNFLGMPVGVNMGLINPWRNLIDKFRSKLSKWKTRTLSIGGRHTIVCNVLGSLGNFLFSLFKAPKGVLHILEGLRRDFFWGSEKDSKKIPWVKWKHVLNDKKNGGLGVVPLEDFNRSLLSKWLWRYRYERGALWVKIIDSIHGSNSCLEGADKIKTGHTWRRIIKQWDELKELHIDPRFLIKKQVGNGRETDFWDDWWIGENLLSKRYPRLYNYEGNKNITVEDKLRDLNGMREESFGDTVREGRSNEERNQLLQEIATITLSDKQDVWVCPKGPNGRFTVEWMRKRIVDSTQEVIGKYRDLTWIPKKHKSQMWKGEKNRLPTIDNLAKLGLNCDSNLCDICKEEAESLVHVILRCKMAKEVWAKVQSWLGTNFCTDHHGLSELFNELESKAHSYLGKKSS